MTLMAVDDEVLSTFEEEQELAPPISYSQALMIVHDGISSSDEEETSTSQ